MPERLGEDLSGEIRRVAAPLREQVACVLRRAIIERRLAPGERLIERELVERLGVSRTTIREVLRQLTAEGLVESIPQRGAVVAMPSEDEAAEIYEVRAALESLVARRFVEHASAAQVAALLAAFDDVAGTMAAGDEADITALLAGKDRFYDVLMQGSGNGAAQEILASLRARTGALRAASARRPGRVLESLTEIAALVRAVERRDAAGAADAAERHVRMAARAGLGADRLGTSVS